jgi:hypothetical protein
MMLGALVLAEGIVGMTEASATRRPRAPRTRSPITLQTSTTRPLSLTAHLPAGSISARA